MHYPSGSTPQVEPLNVLSVSGLTQKVRARLESDTELLDVWVTGEVSNCTRATSGHWYWTLKDADSQIRCVMFRSDAQIALRRWQPANGDTALVHGGLTVYGAQSSYQLRANHCEPVGRGDLHRQFEALKARLEAEGLFAPERKRKPPSYPVRIGVVTSLQAAALKDVWHVIQRRWPVTVLVGPTPVQGDEAPFGIIEALRSVAKAGADVVIVVRGGGSLEDLMAFNNEGVARAIAACPVPVVTGVGHETDFTIADFAADERAPTPTAAAERVTPERDTLVLRVDELSARLDRRCDHVMTARRHTLASLSRRLTVQSPRAKLQSQSERLTRALERRERAVAGFVRLSASRLAASASKLEALAPQRTLDRGFAHVRRASDMRTVSSVRDAAAGAGLLIRVADGEFAAVAAGQSQLFESETH